MITENDVRLLRRVLIALQIGDEPSAMTIAGYLKAKGLKFILPGEQTPEIRKQYWTRLQENERWLANQYGSIMLPDYHDCIFLNSKWRNPYTLYVRLVEEEPDLGDLGAKYWIPPLIGNEEEFRLVAEEAHARYIERNPPEPVGQVTTVAPTKPLPWYKRIFR